MGKHLATPIGIENVDKITPKAISIPDRVSFFVLVIINTPFKNKKGTPTNWHTQIFSYMIIPYVGIIQIRYGRNFSFLSAYSISSRLFNFYFTDKSRVSLPRYYCQ